MKERKTHMLNVAIIIGSTRPSRKAEAVARWSTRSRRSAAMPRSRSSTSHRSIYPPRRTALSRDEPVRQAAHGLIMGEIKIADVRAQVALSLFTDFENFFTFKPRPQQEAAVNAMLDDLVPWAQALHNLRARRTAPG